MVALSWLHFSIASIDQVGCTDKEKNIDGEVRHGLRRRQLSCLKRMCLQKKVGCQTGARIQENSKTAEYYLIASYLPVRQPACIEPYSGMACAYHDRPRKLAIRTDHIALVDPAYSYVV